MATQRGQVFVIAKNMRGPWAPYKPVRDALTGQGGKFVLLDVTSASRANRDHFSPMRIGARQGMCCFENWWQSGKVYEGMDRDKQLEWWRAQTKGKRRYPGSRGRAVRFVTWPDVDGGREVGYLDSRKYVYVPEYWKCIRKDKMFATFRAMVEAGVHVGVVDFDGPRAPSGAPQIEKVTLEMLSKRLQNLQHPFGHAYVVAAGLCGWEPEDYVDTFAPNVQ